MTAKFAGLSGWGALAPLFLWYNESTAEGSSAQALLPGHHRTQDNVELGRWFFTCGKLYKKLVFTYAN